MVPCPLARFKPLAIASIEIESRKRYPPSAYRLRIDLQAQVLTSKSGRFGNPFV
jgi:hypothetical protein